MLCSAGLRQRLSWIILIGGIIIQGAYMVRSIRRPRPVPPEVQRNGVQLLEGILYGFQGKLDPENIRLNLLCDTALDLLDERRIFFTTGLGEESLLRKEAGRPALLYINLLIIPGKYLYPEPDDLLMMVIHETVHSIRLDTYCREEELDAFLAAYQARAVWENESLQGPWLRDGMFLSTFVNNAYPDLPSDPDYKPIEMPLAELYDECGG